MQANENDLKSYNVSLYLIFFFGIILAFIKLFFKEGLHMGLNEIMEQFVLLMAVMCTNYCLLVFFIILILFNTCFSLVLISIQLQQKFLLGKSQMEIEKKYAIYIVLGLTVIYNIVAAIVCFFAYRQYKYQYVKGMV